MNPGDAARLLGVAASFDRWVTVGEADSVAWGIALDGIGFDDARDAVVAHYREETRTVMPADVIRRVKRVRAQRVASLPPIVPPSALGDRPQDEARWTAAYRGGVAAGMDPAAAHARACQRFGVEADGPPVPVDPAAFRAAIEAATTALTGGAND